MAWRGVHISEAARLSIAHKQLVVEQGDELVHLPVEDLAWLVFDTPKATITTAALASLMDAGAAIVQCDGRHLPVGIGLPFHAHYRQGDIARRQIATTTPFKKRAWQLIVRSKIANQAEVLERTNRKGAQQLRMLARRVASGDRENIEAQAARHYWKSLFDDFRRGDDDRRNGLLNYGYAVMRACIARALVAGGLLPAFGVFHDNAANAFNLADDMLEPFRPVVDLAAFRHLNNSPESEKVSIEDRRMMAALPNAPVLIDDDEATALVACERVAQSFIRAIHAGDWSALQLPSLLAPGACVDES
jgi:CRISP-associated protein Cas1